MNMNLPFHLGLRGDRHLLGVIKQPGMHREQLGVPYPPDGNLRQRILTQWAIPAISPRTVPTNGIDHPLPVRAQAILSWQIDSSLRQRIASGVPAPILSRLDSQPGMQERVHLGQDRQPLPVHARFGNRSTSPEMSATPDKRARHG